MISTTHNIPVSDLLAFIRKYNLPVQPLPQGGGRVQFSTAGLEELWPDNPDWGDSFTREIAEVLGKEIPEEYFDIQAAMDLLGITNATPLLDILECGVPAWALHHPVLSAISEPSPIKSLRLRAPVAGALLRVMRDGRRSVTEVDVMAWRVAADMLGRAAVGGGSVPSVMLIWLAKHTIGSGNANKTLSAIYETLMEPRDADMLPLMLLAYMVERDDDG